MSTKTFLQKNQYLTGLKSAAATFSSAAGRHMEDIIAKQPRQEDVVRPELAAMPSRSRSAGRPIGPVSNGLPPLAGPGCKILVLGSLPGAESLRLQQYYAHPRNCFWEMMGAVCGFPSALPYPHRLRALLARDIAIWDVLASGYRPGSLDSAIDLESAEVNPFGSFLQGVPALNRILFNGALAERLYEQRVLPRLPVEFQGIVRLRLPSTSPANASVSKQAKLSAWRAAMDEPE